MICLILEKIPAELYYQTFKNLSEEDLRGSISHVCKKWYKLVQDFSLVENSVILHSPFQHYTERILKDFELYPTFNLKVKVLKMKDEGKDKTENMSCDYGLYKFDPLLQYCSNLEALKIQLSYSSPLFNIMSELLLQKRRLKILELDFAITKKSRRLTKECATVEVDLKRLVNKIMPNLEHLSIHSSIQICEESRFAFACGDLYLINNCSYLKTIKIVCFFSIMTKSCLEYIVSGCFTNLENLDLTLTLVISFQDLLKGYSTIESGDVVVNKLEDYCLTRLKNYNICLLGNTGVDLLTLKKP